MSRRLLVIQHERTCPPGMLEPWLARLGLQCDVLLAHEGWAVPSSLGDRRGLIVLGGSMNAEADADHRWLAPVKTLIVSTVLSQRPFLGICLGHQLAAAALGGKVRRNTAGPTTALVAFSPTAQGRRDRLTAALPLGTDVLHWNNDIVSELPSGAVALATGREGSVQAARFGPAAWGVQFHPEVTSGIVAGWPPGDDRPAEIAALDEFRRRESALQRSWEPLIRRFARLTARGS